MSKPSLHTTDSLSLSENSYYSLSVDRGDEQTVILMRMNIPQVNTIDFPQTRNILQLYLPTILKSTCYNDDNLPFSVEVSRTEIGHLFEHMLLEFLCILKIENGHQRAVYEGVTDWNWVREPRGTFHITIKASSKDLEMLSEAMNRTIILINAILSQEENISINLPIPAVTKRH